MALYKLADFVVNIENEYDYLTGQCAPYRYTGDIPAELSVKVNEDEIQHERIASEGINHSSGYLESICAYRKLCLQLPLYDAMVLHGSVISCGGRGIAFLARSGVGKTTHTMLWKQVYGEKVQIINGDKPVVRFFGGVPFAYGTPWAGKENLQSNNRVQLTDICFIERSEDNFVFRAASDACLDFLAQQILLPTEPAAAGKTLELLDKLMTACNFWIIRCNISEDAAITAHKTIIGEI